MFEWIKSHKWFIAVIGFIIICGVPIIIHVLFKITPENDFFIAEWSAGELLSYYGEVLAFVGTVVLGTLSLYQNQIIKEESNKRVELLEQREREVNAPRFRINNEGSNGKCNNLKISIENISENIANEIFVLVEITDSENEIMWRKPSVRKIDVINSNKKVEIELGNPPLQKNNCCFRMDMKCNDKYGDTHYYKIWAFCETPSSNVHFQIKEIREDESRWNTKEKK